MSVQFYIYTHARPDGRIFYVGKGHGNRCAKMTGRNSHHQNMINKYGKENISVKTMHCSSEEIAFVMEVELIRLLSSIGVELTNKTRGGEGVSGYVFTKEQRLKNSAAQSGKIMSERMRSKTSARMNGNKYKVGTVRTDSQKANNSRLMLGNKHTKGMFHFTNGTINTTAKVCPEGFYPGRTLSKETRESLSKVHKNKIVSVETRTKQSIAHKGIPLSEKHRNSLSLAKKGEKNPFFGKTHSNKTKEKLSVAGANRTPEVRLKLQFSAIGNKRALGHVVSKEVRARISLSKKGKQMSLTQQLQRSAIAATGWAKRKAALFSEISLRG